MKLKGNPIKGKDDVFQFLQKQTGLAADYVAMFLLILIAAGNTYAQDTTKTVPDGTEGVVFTVRAVDTVLVNKKKELPPNEFEGTHSTFRIGLGYIGDYSVYVQDDVFKKQMDSANLDLKNK